MGVGAALLSTISVAAVMRMDNVTATAPEIPASEHQPAVPPGTPAANKPPPHLVMMVIDDLGWTDVGFHGGNYPTPNIDKLAADGIKLDKYYVQQVCSPTRSALMTARYPFRTGLQHTTTLAPGSGAKLPSDTDTLAEVLKRAGYATHAIGKWHLGFESWAETPIGRGFDSYVGYLNGGEDYYTHELGVNVKNVKLTGMDLWRNKTAVRPASLLSAARTATGRPRSRPRHERSRTTHTRRGMRTASTTRASSWRRPNTSSTTMIPRRPCSCTLPTRRCMLRSSSLRTTRRAWRASVRMSHRAFRTRRRPGDTRSARWRRTSTRPSAPSSTCSSRRRCGRTPSSG